MSDQPPVVVNPEPSTRFPAGLSTDQALAQLDDRLSLLEEAVATGNKVDVSPEGQADYAAQLADAQAAVLAARNDAAARAQAAADAQAAYDRLVAAAHVAGTTVPPVSPTQPSPVVDPIPPPTLTGPGASAVLPPAAPPAVGATPDATVTTGPAPVADQPATVVAVPPVAR